MEKSSNEVRFVENSQVTRNSFYCSQSPALPRNNLRRRPSIRYFNAVYGGLSLNLPDVNSELFSARAGERVTIALAK